MAAESCISPHMQKLFSISAETQWPIIFPQWVMASLNDAYGNSTTQPALAKSSEYVNENIKENIIIE